MAIDKNNFLFRQINKEELGKEDPIACASDSIKLGLSIMDEKFQRVEVVASDSEDEGEMLAPRYSYT